MPDDPTPPTLDQRFASIATMLETALGKTTAQAAPAAPAAVAAPAPGEIDYEKLAAAIVKAQPAPVVPAAAPRAPVAFTLPTSEGVVDLFNCSHEQLQHLGARGVKAALSQLWEEGARRSGAPPRLVPPSNTSPAGRYGK